MTVGDAAQEPDKTQGPAAASVFFLLVLALSVPFYLVGLTGSRMPGMPMLPVSALMGFVPMISALILAGQSGGGFAVRRLIARLFEPIGLAGGAWLLLALILMPLVCLIEYLVLREIGVVLPGLSLDGGTVLFLFAAFVVAAVGEELGWQGCAYGALRRDHGMLSSALILGIVWAVWHVIPYIELGREGGWILWHSLSAVALRIMIVWLYENSGRSILIAVVFHAMINLSWAVFPEQGSHYDPFVTLMILAPLAAVIALLWIRGQLHRVAVP